MSPDEWWRPGAYAVRPGVHRIPLPLPGDGLRAVNVYAIEDGDGLVLIDSGWALDQARQDLEAALGTLGHDLGSIRRFLITHIHRDHYTQAVVLRRLFGSRVALGAGEQPGLEQIAQTPVPFSPALTARLHRLGAGTLIEPLLTSYGDTRLDLGEWEDPDEWLRDGSAVSLESRTLDVVATPGHTRGHVVFHDRAAGLLFAGDHVLPHITPSIGFDSPPADSPLSDYLRSLALVAALPDTVLLPAHGPAGGGTHARVRELQAHHDRRLTATAGAVARGADTAYAVARLLPWTRRDRPFATLDVFNQMLAVSETASHLDLLVERGDLTVTTGSAVHRYAARAAV